jgi:hypothetical protein
MLATRHQPARTGAIIAAVWLIGLGTIFLLQQLLDLPWGKAWPMFVILAGVGSLASVLLGLRSTRGLFVALAWPVVLIVVGVLLLLSTTGLLGIAPLELAARWWPVLVIGLGAWLLIGALLPRGTAGTADSVDLPLEGATAASVRVKFGGGSLTIASGQADRLLTGRLEGVEGRVERRGPGEVEISQESVAWPWWDRTPNWTLGLPTGIPVDLRVESGAARCRLDLLDVMLRDLRIQTGASDTRVRLPRAAGTTRAKVEGGAASITLEVPAGVAARIRSQMALGSTNVDPAFPKVGGDRWESPGWEAATNRVELEIEGGVGSVRVVALPA